MDVTNDFVCRHDVYMTIAFEMYGIKRIPSDRIIDALRMLDVCGEILVKAVDMRSGDEIYKHEAEDEGAWM